MKIKCIKCKKEHPNMFKQWSFYKDSIDCDICEDCIKNYKTYIPVTCYSPDMDMTFVFVEARVPLTKSRNNFILLSQTLIGYVYGKHENDDGYVKQMVEQWIRNEGNDRIELLRQSFNENDKYTEEVLY